MNPIDILKEVESDLASLTSLPGEIRAKVKAGVAELTRIRDAVDDEIAAITKSAQATLASLEAKAAEVSGLATGTAATDATAGEAAKVEGAGGQATAAAAPGAIV